MKNFDALQKRNPRLEKIIQEAIEDHHGHLPFSTFMALALYHPTEGYYERPDFNIGQDGDFTTASQLSPFYAQCFANQCVPLLEHLGDASILELGAGSGQFAKDMMLRLKRKGHLPKHYYILETSRFLRDQQKALLARDCPAFYDRFVWLDSFPSEMVGVVIANEVLDALPFQTFEIGQGKVKERSVTCENQTFKWVLSPPSPLLDQKVSALNLTEGYRSEMNLHLPGWIQSLSQSLTKGVILLADYGYGQKEYYHPQRMSGTLTCFYRHRHHGDPLKLVGLQDITAHVDFTWVADCAMDAGLTLSGFCSQQAFLLACGLMDLVQDEEKDLPLIEKFALNQAIKTLTFPSEMGERIKIMALSKGMSMKLLGFQSQDLRREL